MLHAGARLVAITALSLFLAEGPAASQENPVETDGKEGFSQSGVIAVKFRRHQPAWQNRGCVQTRPLFTCFSLPGDSMTG
jgi:hypothetical protein